MTPESVIRSRQNPIYKQIRSLLRRDRRHQERAFLVEGPRFIADAIGLGAQPSTVVLSDSFARQAELLGDIAHLARIFDDGLFASISDTVSSQGMIAVFPIPEIPPMLDVEPFVLVADGIQDPGNLGTLIRSAAGAGATQVVILAGTADPWAPKTVRSAAAAHFVVPIDAMSVEQLASALPEGALVIGAEAGADRTYDQIDLTGPTVLLIGSEGNGLSIGARAIVAEMVSIPLAGPVESLNAGVAGSILLFEGARQRRSDRGNLAKMPVSG